VHPVYQWHNPTPAEPGYVDLRRNCVHIDRERPFHFEWSNNFISSITLGEMAERHIGRTAASRMLEIDGIDLVRIVLAIAEQRSENFVVETISDARLVGTKARTTRSFRVFLSDLQLVFSRFEIYALQGLCNHFVTEQRHT
jgi:hypothetical protein